MAAPPQLMHLHPSSCSSSYSFTPLFFWHLTLNPSRILGQVVSLLCSKPSFAFPHYFEKNQSSLGQHSRPSSFSGLLPAHCTPARSPCSSWVMLGVPQGPSALASTLSAWNPPTPAPPYPHREFPHLLVSVSKWEPPWPPPLLSSLLHSCSPRPWAVLIS